MQKYMLDFAPKINILPLKPLQEILDEWKFPSNIILRESKTKKESSSIVPVGLFVTFNKT